VAFLPVGHLDLAVKFWSIANGGEATATDLELPLAQEMIKQQRVSDDEAMLDGLE
jgi:hypothetical protein